MLSQSFRDLMVALMYAHTHARTHARTHAHTHTRSRMYTKSCDNSPLVGNMTYCNNEFTILLGIVSLVLYHNSTKLLSNS